MNRARLGAVVALTSLLLPAGIQSACAPVAGWTADFDGTEGMMDEAADVAVDSSGNVIVVGFEENSLTGKDWKIIKYDSSGGFVCEASYDGPQASDDAATGVDTDSAGNIWVVGYETDFTAFPADGLQYDWRIRKYSPDLTTVLFEEKYNYEPPPNDDTNGYYNDKAQAVVVDSLDNAIVVGFHSAWGDASMGLDLNYNWVVRKYLSNGTFDWEYIYVYPYGADDIAYSVDVDSSDNIYVAGSVSSGWDGGGVIYTDWYLVKLDSAGGYVTEAGIGGASGWYAAKAIAVDKTDNSVVAAGFQDPGPSFNADGLVVKYSSDLSSQTWVAGINGAAGWNDECRAIAIDSAGNAIVGGYYDDAGGDQDWTVRKFNGLDGTELWRENFSGGSSPNDVANGVAMLSPARVIATGIQAAANGNWRTIEIIQPSCIEAAVSVNPGVVCLGGSIEVVMTVSNTGVGGASVMGATLSIDAGESLVSLVSGPVGTVGIAAGAMQNFTWVFTSVSGGVVGFTATVLGTDDGTSGGILVPVSGFSATIVESATLSSVMSVNPLNVLVGNSFESVLDVSNAGGSDAINVEATMWVDSGGTLISLVSGPGPGPYTVPALGSAQFTWTWQAVGNGLAGFTATVSGSDDCSGSTVATADTGVIVIPGAFLEAALAGIPSPVCAGKQIRVDFTVTNIGTGNATGVSATLSVDEGESLVSLFSSDEGPITIPPLSAHTFSWSFSVSGGPQIAFTATVSGMDFSTGLPVTTPVTVPPILVLAPAELEGEVSVNPNTSPTLSGDLFEVVLTVTNTGGVTATSVTPTMWFDSGGDPAVLAMGPGPADIPAGGSQSFTWVWTASSEGLFALTATATGTDTCQGWSVTADGTGSILVQWLGELEASLGVEPAIQVTGSPVKVILTVTNTGITDVASLSTTIWVEIGASRVALLAEPAPLASLAAGASAKFTWTFGTLQMGMARFSATVSGAEFTLGNPVSASAYADLELLSRGILSAQLVLTPATVVSGGTVRAVAWVWNSAPAGSLGILDVEAVPSPHLPCPAVPQIDVAATGTASVMPVLAPSPGCCSLMVGASSWYTWTFIANGVGDVDFTVSFTGLNETSPFEEIYAVAGRRLSVLAPASLSATLSIFPDCGFPCTASYGDTINLQMEVGNTSGNPAANVHPLTMTMTGTALTLVSSPASNIYIPGFSTYTFEWTYKVSGSGSVTVWWGAGGTEFTLLTPIWSNSASLWMGIPVPTAVEVVATGPGNAIIGQMVTLPVSVSNISATAIIHSGFQVLWNGSSVGVTVVSTDPTLARLMGPGSSRDFLVNVRLDSKAEVGEGSLEVRVVATEQYSSLAVESLGGRMAFELILVSESDPTSTILSVNPWKPALGDLEIRYVVPAPAAGGTVTIRVYTLGGELVKTLLNEGKPEGSHTALWDGRNLRGQKVASGIYLLLVETRAGKRLQKLAVIK